MQNICYNKETHIDAKKSRGFDHNNNIALSCWYSIVTGFPIFQATSSGD